MNEENVLVNEMIQEIALIEYQNSEVIQKYRESLSELQMHILEMMSITENEYWSG